MHFLKSLGRPSKRRSELGLQHSLVVGYGDIPQEDSPRRSFLADKAVGSVIAALTAVAEAVATIRAGVLLELQFCSVTVTS